MIRETKGLVRKRMEEGCIAVEMELAGVQSVCDFYNLKLYAFLKQVTFWIQMDMKPKA